MIKLIKGLPSGSLWFGCGGEKIKLSMKSAEYKISGENKAEHGGWEVGGVWRRMFCRGDAGAEPGDESIDVCSLLPVAVRLLSPYL